MLKSRMLLTFALVLAISACGDEAPTAPVEDRPTPVASLMNPASLELIAPSALGRPAGSGLLTRALDPVPGTVVLDFGQITGFPIPRPYQEDGFSIAISDPPPDDIYGGNPGRFGAVFATSSNFAGSQSLFVNDVRGLDAVLTQDNGEPFTVQSINLAPLFVRSPPESRPPGSTTFVGTRSDGSTVSQSASTIGDTFETIQLVGFTNLVELRWEQVTGFDNGAGTGDFEPHQFDDIVIQLNPTTKADCMKGGWESYGFKNQGQCVRYVETGKDSR